jgi:non-ribosomal peptide synthase protein (TIGR01720 family)
VGWFTSLYPMLLDVEGQDGAGELLKSVKEQVRRLPNHGIGYGVLRSLCGDELGRRVRELPQAQVRFNYLGQFDQVLAETGPFAAARESSGECRSSRGRRPYLLDVNALVLEESLRLDWTYSRALHRRSTIEAVADGFVQALTELIDHCLSPDSGGYTPSDFPLAGLDEKSLERLAALIG